MNRDVTPNFRTNVGECEGRQESCTADACPLYGTYGREARDGNRRVRGCGDPVARGARNSRSGKRAPNKARKVLGLTGANTTHEELWAGPVRAEAKSGAQVGPIWTRFRAARAQSEAARPIGDTRPFVMLVHPKGTSEFLLIVSSDDLAQFLDAYGGSL